MRASLSKSDNALSSNTNVINSRFKRHHSIDDDYPVISSSLSNDEKKIHVHFHPDLISSDHRVPLLNDSQQQITFQKSSFSSELVRVVEWFHQLDSRQKEVLLRELISSCSGSQWHLLSLLTADNWHRNCPIDCSDPLAQLPFDVSFHILSLLDPISLTRCSHVNKLWYYLCSHPELWRKLATQKKWSFSSAILDQQQIESHTNEQDKPQWKQIFIERYRLRSRWLSGRCEVKTFHGHIEGVSCVQFDSQTIISGCTDGTIKVWDMNTTNEIITLVGHSRSVRCLYVDGTNEVRLVSGSNDHSIKVWSISINQTWSKCACKLTLLGHTDTVRCLVVRDDICVSGSHDNSVKVWNLTNGLCLRTLVDHTDKVLCVQFNWDFIVSGSTDKTIKIWRYLDGICLRTLSAHNGSVTCLYFDQQQDLIVSGSLDYDIRFWHLSTGECCQKLDWISKEGHRGVIRTLKADSWRVVSGADDKTIKVWDIRTGVRLCTLKNHTDGVTCLSFNDYLIVSGSFDGSVKLWNFRS
ncbi:unnamed protein product [Rotaria socialis]|nr:unnamed protein product [Rotaria socialis]CAF3382631.1 unnamed protein product [Rotaria socialis]CAF3425162.1 unnamed protein product [Rotaria socialis]CAF3439541.1 unnamed protein product [Rotaria socialis]